MKWKPWAQRLVGGAGVLIALSGATAEGQAAFTAERPPMSGSRTYANAIVVAIDARAGTITVRGGGIGKDETFPVEAPALQRIGVLKPGEPVVLTLGAAGPGREVVIRIERSLMGAGTRPGSAGGPGAPRPRGPSDAAATTTGPAPSPAPSAAATPTPSPETPRLPTDIVGPFRDPRLDPNFDPRRDPLRNPNVVPGLSEPAPTPTPTPPPPAAGLLSHPQLVACLGAAQEIRIFRHSGGA